MEGRGGLAALAIVMVAGCPAAVVRTSSGGGGTTASSTGTSTSEAGDDRASGASTAAIITLPDVTGKTKADAEATLRAAGVHGEISYENTQGADKVCSQSPGAGQQSRTSLGISLTLCEGAARPQETGPNLVGLSVDAATKKIRANGYDRRIEVYDIHDDASCKVDTVCRVEPDRWYLNQQNNIYLYVMRAAKITVPD